MEYISPFVLLPSENIQMLDLSNNKLHIMQEKHTKDFEKLFRAQRKLHYLNLSYNSLSQIPRETFLNNIMLKVLDISNNNIKSLDFSMSQLVSIEKVIASHNMIHTIDHHIRMELELVLRSTPNYGVDGNDSFHLYLEGNQFQCTCDETGMTFIEWLHSVEIIDEKETLTCSLEKNLVDIRGTGLLETKHFCRMETIKRIALISTPIVFTTVMLGIIFAVFIRRHRKRKLRIRTVINQIEAGTFSLPHLVFLSHCNEDSDLVMNKIYPELCKHLSKMTRSNKPLVCLGDKHFRPGYPLRDEVMRCIEESSVFLAIISRNFCKRMWCNLEIGEAYDQKKPIIMLMVEYVEKELMENFLQKIFNRYAHATWKPDDKGGHIEPEWKLFCKSIIQLAGKSTATAHLVDTPAEIIVDKMPF
ncbi:toll-like receptor 2 [Mercenaria mercenaria]|uniref:toll-like receptor 2 n=1 Tax=Mercenaria mercenaria TaxID=6596 RepID=UPI00234F0D27|nr:toll-like receptor 2 [Mercenaria mercenaria]